MAKRIDLAQQLLADSNMTVAGIAAQLGFTDQAHLTKAFRQVVGKRQPHGGASNRTGKHSRIAGSAACFRRSCSSYQVRRSVAVISRPGL